jgi:hypothetical protein
VAYYEYSSGNSEDAGWNNLGNTRLEYMRVTGLCGIDYIVLYNNCSGGYVTRLIEEINLFVGQPFFIQTAGNGYFNLVYNGGSATMPAFYAQRDAKQLMHFTLTEGNGNTDHMYLTMHEDAVPAYTIGRDVARMSTDCKTAAQIWCTMTSGTQLSAQGIEIPATSTTVNIELFAPTAGEYSLNLFTRSMDGYEVELLHNGALVATLHESQPVTLDLNAGNNSGYALRISRKAPTGIGDVQRDDVQCTKVIKDGVLLIERNGKTYNASGAQVR